MSGNSAAGEIHVPGDFGNCHSKNNAVMYFNFLMWRHMIHEALNSFLGVIHCSDFSRSQVLFVTVRQKENASINTHFICSRGPLYQLSVRVT